MQNLPASFRGFLQMHPLGIQFDLISFPEYNGSVDQSAHSSSGPGRRPLKAEITGSNPVCATNYGPVLYPGRIFCGFAARARMDILSVLMPCTNPPQTASRYS